VVELPERDTAKPLRVPISGIYKIKGVGDVLAGRVEQGQVKPNDEVRFMPTHTTANKCEGKVRVIIIVHVAIFPYQFCASPCHVHMMIGCFFCALDGFRSTNVQFAVFLR
jgi:hypothetical protein